jgi:hypothetical protein
MKFPVHIHIIAALLLSSFFAFAGKVEDYAEHIAPLIDPAKLSTLGTRAANPRVQKYVYWLVTAQRDRVKPEKVVDVSLRSVGMAEKAADLTKQAMLRNVDIAAKLGCLDDEGLSEMRKGNAATVRRGPYQGDELSVDHIIPRAVCPELDNVIANLELMPLRLNESKNSNVGQRQRDLAEKLLKAGLLDQNGFKAVQRR